MKTWDCAEFESGFGDILDYCKKTSQAAIVSKTGEGELTVITTETYEALLEKINFYSALLNGMDDAAAGNVIPVEVAEEKLKKKYRDKL